MTTVSTRGYPPLDPITKSDLSTHLGLPSVLLLGSPGPPFKVTLDTSGMWDEGRW